MTEKKQIEELKEMTIAEIYEVLKNYRRVLSEKRDEIEQLKGEVKESSIKSDWWRWAVKLCDDFKIPYDNHKQGIRVAIEFRMHQQRKK